MDRTPSKPHQYKMAQVFGYKGPNQRIMNQDIISAIKFDHKGNYLAVGDHAGRVIVFQTKQSKRGPPVYDYFTQFQSHLKEFDALRSLDVDEEIINIQWLKPQGKYLKLATTNSRSIKLWKMFEKSEKKIVRGAGKELGIPKLQVTDTMFTADLQKSFPNKHITGINTISLANNEEYLMSSDETQIFMWSLQRPDKPFILCDHAPPKGVEQMSEAITCSKFHPSSDSIYLYGMNKGTLRLGDLRQSSKNAGTLFGQNGPHKNYVYQLLSSYSGVSFVKDGKYIGTRDCLTVKLWDVCNPKKPVSSVTLNDGMKSKLCEMVENESIFDRFSLSASPDGSTLLTGSYNNTFHLVDPLQNVNYQYELNYNNKTVHKLMSKGNSVGKVDYSNRTIVGDFTKHKNLLAIASKNTFFTFSMQ